MDISNQTANPSIFCTSSFFTKRHDSVDSDLSKTDTVLDPKLLHYRSPERVLGIKLLKISAIVIPTLLGVVLEAILIHHMTTFSTAGAFTFALGSVALLGMNAQSPHWKLASIIVFTLLTVGMEAALIRHFTTMGRVVGGTFVVGALSVLLWKKIFYGSEAQASLKIRAGLANVENSSTH